MPIAVIIDRLFRFHAAKEWTQPITLHINSSSSAERSLSEFVQLHAVLQLLRSPIHTITLGGIIRGLDVLLMAAGVKGHRYLLPHSIVCIEPFNFGGIGLGKHQMGLGTKREGSVREQATELLAIELNRIVCQLGLRPDLFKEPRVVTAETAIQLGLADVIVTPIQKAFQEQALELQPIITTEEAR